MPYKCKKKTSFELFVQCTGELKLIQTCQRNRITAYNLAQVGYTFKNTLILKHNNFTL